MLLFKVSLHIHLQKQTTVIHVITDHKLWSMIFYTIATDIERTATNNQTLNFRIIISIQTIQPAFLQTLFNWDKYCLSILMSMMQRLHHSVVLIMFPQS